MTNPRDRRDETLDDDDLPIADMGGTLDDSVEPEDDPGSWDDGGSNAGTIASGSGNLVGVDLAEVRRIWGATIDPSVDEGMTIKVEALVESAGVGGDSTQDDGTGGFHAEFATIDEDTPEPGADTVPDADVPFEDHETLADDVLVESRTLEDDADSAALPGTLPDDPEAVASIDADETFVLDDEEADDGARDAEATLDVDEEPSSTVPDASEEPLATVADAVEEPLPTLADSDEAAARVDDDNDRTMIVQDDEDADRTFVIDDEADSDNTVVLGDAGEVPDSGSFSDPQTLDADDPAATLAAGADAGPGPGPDDTWSPRDQAATYVGDDSIRSSGVSADTGLGAEVGITVRPRAFATGEASPDFGADYEIVKQLGQGGMGVVFMARQTSVDREVAVKMLKPPKAGRKKSARKLATQRTKFLAEAVVTGDLDHPNIVPIYDLGTDESGAVFYSMKCVRGTPWDEVIAQKSLSENLAILERVADAMAFAHNRGVVHRDLKPENVMLGDFGEVLVMDWGLALTNEVFTKAGTATKTGSIGGTPSYMAPEMAAGDITKVGTHSDVYLLGAILYEIVTGHPPHSGADVMKCLYNAAKNVIVPTDRTGELVDIAMKAMSSRRRDRYGSVREMQDAIREYQSHSESIAMSMRAAEDLVEARGSNDYEGFAKAMYGFEEAHELWPGNERAARGVSEARLAYANSAMGKGDLDLASTLLRPNDPTHESTRTAIVAAQRERDGRQKRLAMLKRVSVAAAALLFATVTGAAIWVNSARNEAIAQKDEAEKQKTEVERQKGLVENALADVEVERAEAVRQRGLAVEARDDAIDARNDAITARNEAQMAADAEKRAKEKEMTAKVEALAAKDRAEREEKRAKAAAFDAWINQQFAEFARNDAEAAREQAVDAKQAEEVERRNAETQRELAKSRELDALFSGFEAEVRKRAAEYSSSVAELQRMKADVATEQAIAAKELEVAAKVAAIAAEKLAVEAKEKEEYEAYVAQIGLAAAKIDENAFDSARELLLACKPELRNWEWGRLMHLASQSSRDLAGGGPVEAIDVSPDGKLVAAGTWTGDVVIFDRESGEELHRWNDGGLYVNAVVFSPNGKLLATGSSDSDGYVKLWNVATAERVADVEFDGHSDGVLSVAFDPTGQLLLTSSYDETARVWKLDGTEVAVLRGHSWWVWSAVFDPSDPNRVVTASQDGTVGVWNVAKSELVTQFSGHAGPVFAAAVSADGTRVVSGGNDKRLLVWSPASVEPFDFEALAEGREQPELEFRSLGEHNGAVRTIRFGTGENAAVVVSGGHDNTVRIWDLAARTGEEQTKVFRGHDGWVRSAALAPNGRWLVSASQDETAKIWTIADYEEMRVLRGRSLEGHADAVLAADFSPNGDKVVTASRDRTARTYDVRTGHVEHVLREGHEFLATASAFLPNESVLLTAAADDTTRFWDVRTGTQIDRIDGTGRAAAISLSADGKVLLTGGGPVSDNRSEWAAKLWDVGTRKLVRTLPGHGAEVTAVALSADGRLAYTGTAKGVGRLWDVATGRELRVIEGHTERINAAAFLPDGSRVLTGSADHLVAQWNVADGRERTEFALRHGSGVRSMVVTPDGRFVVTSSDNGRVRMWRVTGGEAIRSFGDRTNGLVSSVDVSADGTRIVTTHTAKNAVRVWDAATGDEVTIGENAPFVDWSGRRTPLWSARFTPDGSSILTVGGADARLWDVGTGEEQLSFSPHGAVASAGFSPNGRFVVTGSWDFSAKVWSNETGLAVRKLEGAHTGFVNSARFSPKDDNLVLTASDDGTAKLWDVETAKVVRSLDGHSGPVMHASFSSDGKRIVTASADATARVWNTETGEELVVVRGHEWGVLWAELSRDGNWLVTGSEDNSARLWELTDDGPVERHRLEGHTAAVTSVAYSPDRTRVLTGSRDDTVKLWDAGTGKEILTLDGHDDPVTSVTFSHDGRYALTASRDGRAIVWLSMDWGNAAAVAER